jgi:LEA14-like dessication related protein
MDKFYRALMSIFLLIGVLVVAGCALVQPQLEQPVVKVTRVQLLPSEGLQQRIGVGLLITNPNARDLSVRGISYTIGIEKFSILSGVTDNVPTLKAYQETPVNLEVSANLLELVRLVEYFSRNSVQQNVNYYFDAKLDFSSWLPTMHVKESGQIPLAR